MAPQTAIGHKLKGWLLYSNCRQTWRKDENKLQAFLLQGSFSPNFQPIFTGSRCGTASALKAFQARFQRVKIGRSEVSSLVLTLSFCFVGVSTPHHQTRVGLDLEGSPLGPLRLLLVEERHDRAHLQTGEDAGTGLRPVQRPGGRGGTSSLLCAAIEPGCTHPHRIATRRAHGDLVPQLIQQADLGVVELSRPPLNAP